KQSHCPTRTTLETSFIVAVPRLNTEHAMGGSSRGGGHTNVFTSALAQKQLYALRQFPKMFKSTPGRPF
ncbi:hypothetical protein A2U01_0051901, partial [Trifolium medium]|nr:hypothetical protein [Trifolium medium]